MNREKRIRGLRRYFCTLRRQAATPTALRTGDTTWLTRFQQTFLNVTTDPWSISQPPPQAFRQLWIARLLLTFPHWHAELTRLYPEFYLTIWLYEPAFYDFRGSRLIAAVGENIEFWNNLPGPVADQPLPLEYQNLPGIENLLWQAHAQLHSVSPEEFAADNFWATNKPFWVEEDEHGKTCVTVHYGWVWIGKAHA